MAKDKYRKRIDDLEETVGGIPARFGSGGGGGGGLTLHKGQLKEKLDRPDGDDEHPTADCWLYPYQNNHWADELEEDEADRTEVRVGLWCDIPSDIPAETDVLLIKNKGTYFVIDADRLRCLQNAVYQFYIAGNPTGGSIQMNVSWTTGPEDDEEIHSETVTIPFDSTITEVEELLAAIEGVGEDGVDVTGFTLPNGSQRIEFKGDLAGREVRLNVSWAGLTGGSGVVAFFGQHQVGMGAPPDEPEDEEDE